MMKSLGVFVATVLDFCTFARRFETRGMESGLPMGGALSDAFRE